jgi:acyl-CoA reductase-like NAD-dependent aldehyde dehydrogenase
VYTQDFEKMLKCMRELRAGTVWINDPLTDNDAAPFGGRKGSGIGRELGREGLEAFQESKHIHIDPKVEKKEWWYPYGKDDDPGQRTL